MKHYQNNPKTLTGIRWLTAILLLCLVSFGQTILAQELTVTGTVTDKNGIPIPGANILIKGTSSGIVTDVNGKYSIKADAKATHTLSFIS